MHVFINDCIIPEEKAYIHIKDRGFLLGDGIFETCKVQNGHIEFFDAHYKRLFDSAKTIFIPLNFSADALKKICQELVIKNKLMNKTAAMRITLTRGIGLRGINLPKKPNPTLVISMTEYHPTNDQYPSALITSVKRNQFSPITKIKTLNYLEPILARNEAQSKGFDDGIMINIDGYITECSAANIFFVKNKSVLTPSIESGVLPGVVRERVIHLCRKNNISVIEKNITQDEALKSDEVFQTNSLTGIQPLSQINHIKFSIADFSITNTLITHFIKYTSNRLLFPL